MNIVKVLRVVSGGGGRRFRHHHCSTLFSGAVNRSSSSSSSSSYMIYGGNRSFPSASHHYYSSTPPNNSTLVQDLIDEISQLLPFPSASHKSSSIPPGFSLIGALADEYWRDEKTLKDAGGGKNKMGAGGKKIECFDPIIKHSGEYEGERIPFKIECFEGRIRLSREYEGESIFIGVQNMQPPPLVGEAAATRKTVYFCEQEKKFKPNIVYLIVSIIRSLEEEEDAVKFACTVYKDNILVLSVPFIKPYDSPADPPHNTYLVGDDLQIAFQKYLEKRGVKPNIISVLQEYMIHKDSTKCTTTSSPGKPEYMIHKDSTKCTTASSGETQKVSFMVLIEVHE